MDWNAIAENPIVKGLGSFFRDMIPMGAAHGLLQWMFGMKFAQRKPDTTGQFEDEKEYRRIAAKCRDRLEREGKGEEVLVDEVDALMAGLTEFEAFRFRESINLTKDEEEKILMFMDVAKAPPEAREAKIKAIAQPPNMIRWAAEDMFGAYGRYKETLRPSVMSDDMVRRLGEFTSSLNVAEHLQWRLAIGNFKDQTERLEAIREITNLAQDQRYARARAREYINMSLWRITEEQLVRFWHWLENGLDAIDQRAAQWANQLQTHNDATQARRAATQPLGWRIVELLTGYRR